ncbi:phosphatase PAP2 family protein [Vogesella oryzae]|uniref:phosphatase PAP2 family protein n=1 Tax=Vogesella oryzae TaxID=1735285 RepID=UPI001FE6734F|nr:phosphatase PAP2 family protein [Vogesella oryzae]
MLLAAVWAGLTLLLLVSGANQPVFLLLHHASHALPAVCWRLLSMAGEWTLVIALLLWRAALVPEKLPRYVLAVVAGIAAAIALKAGFAVQRPPLVLPQGSVQLLDVLPGNGSFPSGHAMAVALMCGLLAGRSHRGWQVAGLLLVALVCLSRLAIGVHWPLDVCAGAAVGYLLAVVASCVPAKRWPRGRQLLVLLLLLSVSVALWKLRLGVPNEAYLGYNLMVLVLALLAWRQNKNGA